MYMTEVPDDYRRVALELATEASRSTISAPPASCGSTVWAQNIVAVLFVQRAAITTIRCFPARAHDPASGPLSDSDFGARKSRPSREDQGQKCEWQILPRAVQRGVKVASFTKYGFP